MTDGIVQKTMKEFNFKYRSNPRWNTKWNEEQMQELIEKIKQEFVERPLSNLDYSAWKHGYNYATTDYLQILIGDNKE